MTHRIMKELRRDHVNIGRLLKLLDLELEKLKGDGDIDVELMIDIIDYVENYPDLVHHPREDILYKAYKAKSLEAAEIVDGLLKQHQQLPILTRAFRELLEEVHIGALIISRDELYARARDYIDQQRSHLNTEEALMFPIILETLDQDDWGALEVSMQAHTDPLFDAEVDRYENLLSYLKSHESAQDKEPETV